MSDPRYPDLEIYIKSSDLDELAQAITEILPISDWDTADSVYRASLVLEGDSTEICLRARAYKNFTSLWIKKNLTPWSTDFDLALALSQGIQSEIRCSIGSWTGEDTPEKELWWRIKNNDRQQVQWS